MTRLIRLGLLMLWLAGLVLWVASPVLVAAQRQPAPQSSTSSDLSEAQRLNQQVGKLLSEGRYDEAIPLAARALAIAEKALGGEHLGLAALLNNLAYLYRAKGDDGRAEPFYQRALAIKEKALGPGHPTTRHTHATRHAASA
ncbi:MAG: tetratricopeptide repeat protein [Blastocatellia bacterium]